VPASILPRRRKPAPSFHTITSRFREVFFTIVSNPAPPRTIAVSENATRKIRTVVFPGDFLAVRSDVPRD
jgi:hypothetical protein